MRVYVCMKVCEIIMKNIFLAVNYGQKKFGTHWPKPRLPYPWRFVTSLTQERLPAFQVLLDPVLPEFPEILGKKGAMSMIHFSSSVTLFTLKMRLYISIFNLEYFIF